MSIDAKGCTRCGGWVGYDLATGLPWSLCGWCYRGLDPGKCIDCGVSTGRLRCPPCHELYKAGRDGVAMTRTRPTPSPYVLACVRCGSDVPVYRPSAVTPLCDRCKAKAENAKVAAVGRRAHRKTQRERRRRP